VELCELHGRDLSPSEMYAACAGISGYVPFPFTGDDYIELLPAVFRTVNDYGLTIDNRTYDCKALNPYRRLDSGLPGGNRNVKSTTTPVTSLLSGCVTTAPMSGSPSRGSTGPWPDSPSALPCGSTRAG
jgi:hypothetical protein